MADIFLDDLLSRRERGITCATRFLNEAELSLTVKELEARGEAHTVFGGCDGAVRARIIFPAFWESDSIDLTEYVVSVRIKGSSYSHFKHSDFLGSLTGLGISRDVLGDIVVSEDNASAVLFCDPSIKKFLLNEPQPLERVGREKVRTEDFNADGFTVGQAFEKQSCFVSSMRLDCVTAALCGVSREKSKEIIVSGNAVLNYVQTAVPDHTVTENDVLSVRGKGKYRIESITGTTKKGRICLDVVKYI